LVSSLMLDFQILLSNIFIQDRAKPLLLTHANNDLCNSGSRAIKWKMATELVVCACVYIN